MAAVHEQSPPRLRTCPRVLRVGAPLENNRLHAPRRDAGRAMVAERTHPRATTCPTCAFPGARSGHGTGIDLVGTPPRQLPARVRARLQRPRAFADRQPGGLVLPWQVAVAGATHVQLPAMEHQRWRPGALRLAAGL